MLGKLKDFFQKCTRVWRITRKPTPTEFKTISKVSAIGVLIIGLIGFLVALIMVFVR